MTRPIVVALAVAGVVAGARAARAEDTFEARAAGAQPLRRIASLVWALTSACDAGDDVQQRQCRHVRDQRARELATGTWLVEADADAFEVGPWNPQTKSVPVQLDACIRCAGVEVDGKTWFVTAATGAPRFAGGKLQTAALHATARAFADEATAAMWSRTVSNVRVELVVRLAAKPRWTESGKSGLALDVLAYRVITPCDGSVIVASPASGAVAPDKKACRAPSAQPPVTEAEAGPRVEQLTAAMIDEAMQPVVDEAWKCYRKLAVTGKAKLKITITGDGEILKYEQQGDFTHTPTGACIDKAVAKARFPHSQKAKTTVLFPITLQP